MADEIGQSDAADLLARVAMGDRQAFDSLYERTSSRLFPIAIAMLGDRHEAEEALQDAFVSIWRKADRFRPDEGTPLGWMSVIVRNAAIDRRRRRRDTPVEDAFFHRACELPGPEAMSIASSEARRLHRCLEELSEDELRPIRQAFFGMQSYSEVAAGEGVPLGTMKSRIRRALGRLRSCFEGAAGAKGARVHEGGGAHE